MSRPNGTSVQQNDPSELLEVFDAAGRPTGTADTRAAIHLSGRWHQAFHCWILRHGGTEIVLQRRALTKDTFGGFWDATAAGHWRFGETPEQAAREIAEELGLEVRFEALQYCGRERLSRRFASGLIDREHHQVYVLNSDAALSDYRPDPSEVIGLAAFQAPKLLAVCAGQLEGTCATEAVTVDAAGALSAARISVTREEIVPYSATRLRRLLGCSQTDAKIETPWLKVTRTRRRPSARA